MANINILHIANEKLRRGEVDSALEMYSQILELSPIYKTIAETNINIAKRIKSKNLQRESAIGTKLLANLQNEQSNITHSNEFRIAVIFHVFHEDIVEEIVDSIAKIKQGISLYITSPLTKGSKSIKYILSRYPDAIYAHSRNRGRDILPFLNTYPQVMDFDLCLKIHTKKGLTNFGNLWREVSLQSLLESEKSIAEIVNHFRTNPQLTIAGPRDFYCSGRGLIHGNHANIKNICKELQMDYDENREWAFFAGTMFWFRPSLFKKYYLQLCKLNFDKETGKQDGGVEHSVERIFGLIPSYLNHKALLLSNINNAAEIVNLPDKVGIDDPTKALERIAKNRLAKLSISGDVNRQSTGALSDMKVRGWLAKLNDKTQRQFVVTIGNQEFRGMANIYRSDLQEHGIHQGCHAFEVNVPLKFADGAEHGISLFDESSGLPVATGKYKWATIRRSYSNFQEYLAWSYCGQFVTVPFVEEDKRVLSVMELIANFLEKSSRKDGEKIKFSIIMPTYNRAEIISTAINSILNQSYKNWELLVIDDGSTDSTSNIMGNFTDNRIRYLQNSENVGVSAARNIGLKSATGDYIAYLDSDNDWDSRFLGAMAGAILYHIKSAQALYSGQLVFVGKDREISGVRFGLFNKSLLFNNNYIDLNCFVHKRRIANQLIQFDESIPRFVDWEFIVRISRISPIASVPVLLSNYYLGVSENALTLNDSLKDHIDYVRTKIEANRSHHFHGSDSVVKIGLKNGISIIIPSYEALGDIEKCLETIEPYLLTERKIELIIVDNNSSSDVVRSLDNFSNRYKSCVKFIKLDKNYGFTYAVNRGIEVSNHLNDLLLLNNDAMLTEGSLYTLQQCLYSDDRIGAAVPAQILPGGTESICTHVPYALPEYDVDVNISAHHKNLRFPPLFYEGEPLEIDFAPFFCVLIKNATRMRVPYLDEINGRHYRSDRTYCSFIRDVLGLSIVYCPDSHVYHGLQKSTKELKDEKRNSNDYNTIFVENLWTEDELEKLSFNLPVWNRKY